MKNPNTLELSNLDQLAFLADITIAVDFLHMAFRAVAEGHQDESPLVREPILMAASKCREMAMIYAPPGGRT